MRVAERRERLLRALAEKRTLTLRSAMQLTESSEATVRRDFAALAEEGLVERKWGTIRLPLGQRNSPFAFRQVQYSEEKAALARAAVKYLSPHNVVFIDGGTTTFHLASFLPAIPLKIITNSLRLIGELERHPGMGRDYDVYATGGRVYAEEGLLTGAGAQSGLRQYHAQWAFLSVGGLSETGLYNTNERVVEAEREMVRNADNVVVLADRSKVGRHAMAHVCALREIDMLITDADPAEYPVLAHARELGIQVVQVTPAAAPPGDTPAPAGG